jgi:cytochrome b6
MKTLEYRYILQRVSTILAVVTLTLVLVTAVTGILIAYYYEPTAGGAFKSLQYITESVPSGNLVRSLHDVAGNAVIVVGLIDILVMFIGRQTKLSWFIAWVSGFMMTLVAMGLSWTAIPLDWQQEGFWRFKIELGIIESIPVVGPVLRSVLTGGGGISTTTLEHMYTLHGYVLSLIGLTLSVVHLASLVYQEHERRGVRQQLDSMVTRSLNPNQPAETAIGEVPAQTN